MVRHLQNLDFFRYRKASFDVARQESRGWPGLQKQNDRVIVLVVPFRRPVRRRVQHREWSDRLTSADPSYGDLLYLQPFNQLFIPWSHRVTPKPELPHSEVLD